jgi:hypothetical protein
MCICIPPMQMDMCSMEEVDEIARRPNSVPISCVAKLNLDGLLEAIWEAMALVGLGNRGAAGQHTGPMTAPRLQAHALVLGSIVMEMWYMWLWTSTWLWG